MRPRRGEHPGAEAAAGGRLEGTDTAVRAEGLWKTYTAWSTPSARLWSGLHRRAAHLPLPTAFRAGAARRAERGRIEFHALRDVSLSLAPGDALGIIGRNGSGKSTLLQIVAGTLAPSAGAVGVRGRVAALLELGSGFHPEFSGRENARLYASILGLSARETEARLPAMAEFADIGAFLDQPVRTYSSGMVVRLAFAVAVGVDADVLVIDEALAVGDAGFQFKCLARLRHLNGAGVTLLFVSHDMMTVKSFCTRALYLEAGRVKAEGDAEAVCERYFLDLRNEQRRAAQQGATLAERPSLGERSPLSFGSPEGCILEAAFADGGGRRAVLDHGEIVRVDVGVRVESGVADPCLSLLLLTGRLIPVAGRRLPLALHDGGTTRVRFAFPARLTPGRYFLTLRLERGRVTANALLIEKQTAALEFDVTARANDDLLGLFDLGIQAEEQPELEPASR